MTVLTPDLLASFDASVTDVANADDDAAGDLHVRRVPRLRAARPCSPTSGCASAWPSRIPNVGDYFTTTVNGEPIIVARGKDGAVRAFSAICQHRGDAGRRRRRQLHQVHVPVPPLELRPRPAACSARRRWSAPTDFDKKDFPLPALAGRAVAGLRVRQLRSRRRAAGARRWPRYEPFVEHYDLEHAVCPGTFTLPDLPWNWKVMFENFNDGYHANKLHHTIQDFCPSELAAFPVEWTDGLERHLPHQRLHPHRRRLQRHHEGAAAGLPAS